MRWPVVVLVLSCACVCAGCFIGTWPDPENNKRDAAASPPGGAPISTEPCDGLDNDADGSVDEGCACVSGDVRGCVGSAGELCGFGVQRCYGFRWGECEDLRAPWTPRRTPGLVDLELSVPTLRVNAPEPVRLTVRVVAECEGITAPSVEVGLDVEAPAMRVRGVALDDGRGADERPADRVFSVELPNPFGPGVTATSVRLWATAMLSAKTLESAVELPLERP